MYQQNYNPYQNNAEIVKRYFSSPKVLILSILYFVSVIVTLITTLAEASWMQMIKEMMNSIYQNSSPRSEADAVIASLQASTVSSVISSVIVTVLIAVAFLLIFLMSRSAGKTPYAGLTILYVLAMISFISAIVLVSISAIVFIIAMIGAIASASHSSSSSAGYAVLGVFVCVVVFIVFAVVFIIYTASCKNFYRSARSSLRSDRLDSRGASVYGVFSIIFAVFRGVGLISLYIGYTILSHELNAYDRRFLPDSSFFAFASFSTVLQIVIMVFTAILALGYGSYIKNQKNRPAPPAGGNSYAGDYGTPVYQPAAPDGYWQNAPQQPYPNTYGEDGANAPADDRNPYSRY